MEIWIPFLQSLIWPVFIGILLLFFRGWFRELLDTIKQRIENGSEMSLGPNGFMLGSGPKLEPGIEDASAPKVFEKFVEDSKKGAPQEEMELNLSKYFQLVHSATYNPKISKQRGKPYYTIRVQLETEFPSLMQKVSKVIYHLHPSFPKPETEIKDRENSFELKTAAWGQFNLSADVYFDNTLEPLRLFRYINF